MESFIIVNRRTRKILARFESREEAEAFCAGLITTDPTAESYLSVRKPFGDQKDPSGGAARKTRQATYAPPPGALTDRTPQISSLAVRVEPATPCDRRLDVTQVWL